MSEEYIGKKIVVRWDIMKCAHAGKCVKALPAVFDVKTDSYIFELNIHDSKPFF